MATYDVELKFKGGCFNCPLCSPIRRQCQILKEVIGWRFKAKEGFLVDENGMPLVDIVFDPYTERPKECPLKKKTKKKSQ